MTGATATALRSVRPGPVFAGLVVVTGLGGWLCWQAEPGRNLESVTGTILLVLGGWLVSLSLHEFAHAFTAFRFGDRSAEVRGYLTLNPLKYSHAALSIGLPVLIILLGGIGFPGGAVYLNTARFTRAQRTAVSLAGPATNLALAVLLLVATRFGYSSSAGGSLTFWGALAMLAFLQLTATVLNLLPVPGFDGYGAIEPYLSAPARASMAKIAPYGFLIIFALLFIPFLNRAFFDVVFGLFELSGVPSALAGYGWGLFLFWR